ncbi:MAG: secondary thiamine-phosphate synthase [Legionellales bacterium]|nr:secondary thiamine-phosphate synthase [Legionellales bacterium]|tara:strand:- start:17677 stop:18093 length:417 start_codon:yes stop_codon:yes gene_type:complete
MIYQQQLSINTGGRGTSNITADIARIVGQSKIEVGLCNIFVQHTSASLIISENADAAVQGDLESFMARLVPDGDKIFRHTDEGPDDMPAHMRSVLTETSINIPVNRSRLNLGTWQGIYLWEHRIASHHRKLIVSVFGE